MALMILGLFMTVRLASLKAMGSANTRTLRLLRVPCVISIIMTSMVVHCALALLLVSRLRMKTEACSRHLEGQQQR